MMVNILARLLGLDGSEQNNEVSEPDKTIEKPLRRRMAKESRMIRDLRRSRKITTKEKRKEEDE
tara:strand:- start:2553 stop:2744 length:192 start_codon:yes stop_codon:yes gene_type:complete